MKLSDDEVAEKLKLHRGWEYKDGHIEKTYSFKDFMTALAMVNKLGLIAEHEDHHPDILIRYNKVTFILTTHSEGGVTDKDFKMVREIEKTALENM